MYIYIYIYIIQKESKSTVEVSNMDTYRILPRRFIR